MSLTLRLCLGRCCTIPTAGGGIDLNEIGGVQLGTSNRYSRVPYWHSALESPPSNLKICAGGAATDIEQ